MKLEVNYSGIRIIRLTGVPVINVYHIGISLTKTGINTISYCHKSIFINEKYIL